MEHQRQKRQNLIFNEASEFNAFSNNIDIAPSNYTSSLEFGSEWRNGGPVSTPDRTRSSCDGRISLIRFSPGGSSFLVHYITNSTILSCL
jgi:hypothetical protein